MAGVFLVLFSVAVGPYLLGFSYLTTLRLNVVQQSKSLSTVLATILTTSLCVGVGVAGKQLIDISSKYFWYQGSE